MAKRLIDLKQIRAEKISRGRQWIYEQMDHGDPKFSRPLDLAIGDSNLWDEAEVDRWLEAFVAKAKERAVNGEYSGKQRTARALAARARVRTSDGE